MIRVEVDIGYLGGEGKSWLETFDVSCEESMTCEVQKAIEDFNANRRYPGERLREVRSEVRVVKAMKLHVWRKVNLVTLSDMTDVVKCSSCGLQVRCQGLWRPPVDYLGGCKF